MQMRRGLLDRLSHPQPVRSGALPRAPRASLSTSERSYLPAGARRERAGTSDWPRPQPQRLDPQLQRENAPSQPLPVRPDLGTPNLRGHPGERDSPPMALHPKSRGTRRLQALLRSHHVARILRQIDPRQTAQSSACRAIHFQESRSWQNTARNRSGHSQHGS